MWDTENWRLFASEGSQTEAVLVSPLLTRRHYADVALALAIVARAGG
jgi:hypothetical protein